jgi:hypothetical protein
MYSINGYNMNERTGQINCYLVKGEKKGLEWLLLFDSVLHQAAALFASTAHMFQCWYLESKQN